MLADGFKHRCFGLLLGPFGFGPPPLILHLHEQVNPGADTLYITGRLVSLRFEQIEAQRLAQQLLVEHVYLLAE